MVCELVAILAFERRAFEFLGVRAHGFSFLPNRSGDGWGVSRWSVAGRADRGDRGLEITGTTVKERVGGRLVERVRRQGRLPLHQRDASPTDAGIRWEVRRGIVVTASYCAAQPPNDDRGIVQGEDFAGQPDPGSRSARRLGCVVRSGARRVAR